MPQGMVVAGFNANIAWQEPGAAYTLYTVTGRFRKWLPKTEDIGPAPVAFGTGLTSRWIERTDYTVTLQIDHLAPLALSTMQELARWLEAGGQVTVNTSDVFSHSYTCVIKPKSKIVISGPDPKTFDYSIALELKNVAAASMSCIYQTRAPAGYTLTVNPSSLTVLAGVGPAQLTATLTDPQGNVIAGLPVYWYSPAPNIAGISATGVLTPNAAGGVTIVATCAGIQAYCNVTVNSNSAPATITLAPAPLAFTAVTYTGTPQVGVSGVPAQTVTATIKNSAGAVITYAPGALTWSLSDPTAATLVDNLNGTATLIPLRGSINVTLTATSTINNAVLGTATVTSAASTACALVPSSASITLTGAGNQQSVTVTTIDQYGVTKP